MQGLDKFRTSNEQVIKKYEEVERSDATIASLGECDYIRERQQWQKDNGLHNVCQQFELAIAQAGLEPPYLGAAVAHMNFIAALQDLCKYCGYTALQVLEEVAWEETFHRDHRFHVDFDYFSAKEDEDQRKSLQKAEEMNHKHF